MRQSEKVVARTPPVPDHTGNSVDGYSAGASRHQIDKERASPSSSTRRSAGPKLPSSFRTVRAVASYCAVSSKTVRRWIDDGDLIAHRLGRALRIADDDLQAFLRRHRG